MDKTRQVSALEERDRSEPVGAAETRLKRSIAWAAESLRKRGVIRTLKVAASGVMDVWFDWRYGTDTVRVVEVENLGAASINTRHAVHYQATKARPFRRLLERLQLPSDAVFVDFGAGKGRVLLLAATLGFKRVVGIEFSPALCALARRNVEIYRRKVRRLAPIELIEADATEYELRDDETVFYFYNPFDEFILGRVLENIHRSLRRRPRAAWLIYCVPMHGSLIETAAIFSRCQVFEMGGVEFRVFSEPNGTGASA